MSKNVVSQALGRYTALALTSLLMLGCSNQQGIPSTSDSVLKQQSTLLLHQEAETMTNAGGCTGIQATTVTYYCNNDATFNSYNFAQTGRFSLTVRGASSNTTAASIAVYVDGSKVGSVSFSGSTFVNKSLVFDTSTTGNKEIRLKMETDTGANDTLVDFYELSYEGVTPPPPPPPTPSATGAFASKVYRNIFKEWNPALTDTDIKDKVNSYWDSLFANTDDTKRVYYPYTSNINGPMAYILDTGNNDVRSEGVSYGMMIAVQMNKQTEFDALWNYAKSIMQHKALKADGTPDPRAGYFSWQIKDIKGDSIDPNAASDGEEYFATALLFAGNRWGNKAGIYNYTLEANSILNTMLHKEEMNAALNLNSNDGVTNMFNRTTKQVVFVPVGSAATFTDPSYHLPAFYEIWAREATGYNGQGAADRQFWSEAATTSRAFFEKSTNSVTGLNPDYAEFNGAPKVEGGHESFRFDAWRTAVNWSVDHAWWAKDSNQIARSNKLQSFFVNQGLSSYLNQYTLAGTALSTDRSPGLIASNGAASLAANDSRAWKFVEEQWNLTPPTGQWRYYDGLLSFMALLHSSGNFKIYSSGLVVDPPPNLVPTVSLTSPTNGSTLPAGTTSVTIKASATDSDGTLSSVKFYNGATLISTDTTAPYEATATGLTAGNYTFKATATDNLGATATSSSSVTIAAIAGNVAPTVSITSPVSGTVLPAGTTSVTVKANAADSDGTVSSVKFYNGATLVATDTTTPFEANVTGLTNGTAYTLKAVATDNQGATFEATSSISVANPVVTGASCKMTFSKNEWPTGATVQVTVTNTGSSAINGWTAAFSFPGNQKISQLWNGTVTQTGQNVSVKDLGYNSSIPVGGNVGFGFNLDYSGTNGNFTGFSINGKTCS
jgi:endo-1,4-beta-D-glucanase Y